jgi:beta-phosphoglucomutase-like phosphatase (HAD superfamily)
MIDVVLCELEGVLIDCAAQRRRALQRAFAGEGISLRDALYDEQCSGKSTALAVEAALHALQRSDDPVLPELLVLGGGRHFRSEISRGVLLAPGAADFLEATRATSRVALVTRTARAEAELLLSVAGLDSAFECMVCADDVRHLATSAALYQAALARLGRHRALDRSRVVALVNGMGGAGAARAAGVYPIVVGCAPCDEPTEVTAVASLADVTTASLEALMAPVKEYAA